jgi:hypothetical protein
MCFFHINNTAYKNLLEFFHMLNSCLIVVVVKADF